MSWITNLKFFNLLKFLTPSKIILRENYHEILCKNMIIYLNELLELKDVGLI